MIKKTRLNRAIAMILVIFILVFSPLFYYQRSIAYADEMLKNNAVVLIAKLMTLGVAGVLAIQQQTESEISNAIGKMYEATEIIKETLWNTLSLNARYFWYKIANGSESADITEFENLDTTVRQDIVNEVENIETQGYLDLETAVNYEIMETSAVGIDNWLRLNRNVPEGYEFYLGDYGATFTYDVGGDVGYIYIQEGNTNNEIWTFNGQTETVIKSDINLTDLGTTYFTFKNYITMYFVGSDGITYKLFMKMTEKIYDSWVNEETDKVFFNDLTLSTINANRDYYIQLYEVVNGVETLLKTEYLDENKTDIVKVLDVIRTYTGYDLSTTQIYQEGACLKETINQMYDGVKLVVPQSTTAKTLDRMYIADIVGDITTFKTEIAGQLLDSPWQYDVDVNDGEDVIIVGNPVTTDGTQSIEYPNVQVGDGTITTPGDTTGDTTITFPEVITVTPEVSTEIPISDYNIPDLLKLLVLILIAILKFFLEFLKLLIAIFGIPPDGSMIPETARQVVDWFKNNTIPVFNMSLIDIITYSTLIFVSIRIAKLLSRKIRYHA